MERYICIHGHFYQPPRENPWLEGIELQDSAYPFHDWNERITAECYNTNGSSRILDSEYRIIQIVNNYARMSFNFGPTLLSWMQENDPQAYQAILSADRESRERFGGHGSAMAQAYNHMIMPLAHPRDKETQVIWGIRDFEHRFGRRPEGMWLPETAANIETLEMLAKHEIKFTVLSPYQANRVRPLPPATTKDKKGKKGKKGKTSKTSKTVEPEPEWTYVDGGRIDPTMAYEQRLPSGQSMTLFFYDGPISQNVAFEGVLKRGEDFAHRLMEAFFSARDWPQLVHIATDGETYGHHHRHGEMALSYAFKYIEEHNLARLTNYGEYLALHPPTHEVDIIDNTSWSCYHGVERWWRNCGCNSGGHPDWNQEWREPLRNALDWLRDELVAPFEQHGAHLLKDPWAARNDYIFVIMDRSPDKVETFFAEHATRELHHEEKIRVLKLMELQRHAMLMYTSCGWFFDELSGIETVQIIRYAGRVLQLAGELFGIHLEPDFLGRLQQARSNIPDHRDGAHIYHKFVRPSMINLEKVGAHYAVSSLFEAYGEQTKIYHYRVDLLHNHIFESGRTRLSIGKACVTSEITWESMVISFGVIYFGDQDLKGGLRPFIHEDAYQWFLGEVSAAFHAGDFEAVTDILARSLQGLDYTLQSLFRDEQRAVMALVLDASLQEAEALYRQLYNQNAALISFLLDLGIPLPRGFHTAAEFVLNADFLQAIEQEHIDLARIRAILEEAQRAAIEFDGAGLGHALEETLVRSMRAFAHEPADLARLETLVAVVELVHALPFDVDFWQAQNIYYKMLETVYPSYRTQAEHEQHEMAQTWLQHFVRLGEQLGVRVR